jgi:uncharacterized protein YukE
MPFRFADPSELRSMADRIGRQAAATRAGADSLGRAVGAVGWAGRAADAFRAQAGGVVHHLGRAADGLDVAAAALRGHAENVQRELGRLLQLGDDLAELGGDLLGTISAPFTDPGAALGELGNDLADGVKVIGDVADSALGLVGL